MRLRERLASVGHRVGRRLLRPAFKRKQRASLRERGVALVIVSVIIALLSALVMEFSSSTNRELMAAYNARDELRAELLAHSGEDLSKLIIKFQQVFLDKARAQLHMDIQLGDFANMILTAFSGSKDDVAGLESMLGLPAAKTKGLGLDKDAGTFSVSISTEDSKINVNCAAQGLAAQGPLAIRIGALFAPKRYDVLFSTPDLDGQITDRATMTAAIIDWIDPDTAFFGNPSSPEDYGYDRLKDPYKSHDNALDSVQELRMVRGMNDDMWAAFGSSFTAYGDCKVNVSALASTDWPIIASIILYAAQNPQDPVLGNEVALVSLAQKVAGIRAFMGGFYDLSSFAQAVQNPGMLGQLGVMMQQMQQTQTTQGMGGTPAAQMVQGVQLDMGKLGQVAEAGPRRVYRIESTGIVGNVERKITGIYDTMKVNSNATDLAYKQGAWVYWREE
jgi:general secretion pathway protein K